MFLTLWTHANEVSDLPQKTVDPTASLPNISLSETHSFGLWRMPGNRDTYTLGVTNPFFLWDQHNLFNVTIPYTTGDGVDPGLGSTKLFDLLIFNRPWGRWGIGYDASLSPPSPGKEGLQSGPALGIVTVINKCNLGLLNLNFFDRYTSASAIQIIAGCSIGAGWTLSSGNFAPVYNWKSGKFLEVPISTQVGKVIELWRQPLRLFVNPRYGIQDTLGTAKWSIIFGITFVANPFAEVAAK
jgi:hypothetical protein